MYPLAAAVTTVEENRSTSTTTAISPAGRAARLRAADPPRYHAPMQQLDFKGKMFVVTGASSGLGREIARLLALQEGADLVVAARRRDRLEALKAEIETASGAAVRVHVVPLDASAPDAAQTLFREAQAAGDVFGLVNCAALTFWGRTLDTPEGRQEEMVRVNFQFPMRLTQLFLRVFLERGEGAVLTVTSQAAFVPFPYQNIYAATKHALQAFMEGLAREYRGRGVRVTTVAPGGMATEWLATYGLDRKFSSSNPVNMDPRKAAALAVRALKRGKLLGVPGLLNKVLIFGVRLLPRSAVAAIADWLFAPPKGQGSMGRGSTPPEGRGSTPPEGTPPSAPAT